MTDSKLSSSRNGSRLSSSGVPIDRTRWTPAPSITGRGGTTRATGRETGLDMESLLGAYKYAPRCKMGAETRKLEIRMLKRRSCDLPSFRSFGFWSFDFVSDFGFRISDF